MRHVRDPGVRAQKVRSPGVQSRSSGSEFGIPESRVQVKNRPLSIQKLLISDAERRTSALSLGTPDLRPRTADLGSRMPDAELSIY